MFIIGCATRHKIERRNKVFAGKLTNGLKQAHPMMNIDEKLREH
jgi:hypothetical protein